MNQPGPVLRVRGLSARIGQQQVVEDVTLEVPAQGVTALLGRNGVGKTSTIKAVLGLVERSGVVELDGERIDTLPTHRIVQRGVGYVPEDREVFGSLSVEENLRLAERSANPRRELVADLFPDIIARGQQAAGTLSGGQQQMVALARALLNDNRLLLVDEPTKGLSPKLVGEVTEVADIADASSGVATYAVTVAFDDTSGDFNAGATVLVDITVSEVTDVVQVSSLAVTTSDGESTVTVVADDGSDEARAVTTGMSAGSMVEITSGLEPGERVRLALPGGGGGGLGTGGEGVPPELPEGFEPPAGVGR